MSIPLGYLCCSSFQCLPVLSLNVTRRVSCPSRFRRCWSERGKSSKVMSRGAFPMRGWCTRGMTRIILHVSFYLRLPYTIIFSTRTNLACNDGVHVAPPVAAPEQRSQPSRILAPSHLIPPRIQRASRPSVSRTAIDPTNTRRQRPEEMLDLFLRRKRRWSRDFGLERSLPLCPCSTRGLSPRLDR